MSRTLTPYVLMTCLLACLAAAALADDWPTYRHDIARSGVSTERLAAPLSEQWTFAPTLPPAHAWGDPMAKTVEKVLELPRLRFDDAFHVAAVGDRVYFGSSSEDKICALDAATGRIVWEFFTEGPVRLAPTVAGGRVYAGSDDGMIYCLDAADGRLNWSWAAAPGGQRVLGNGRMISLWPVRTGVVVDGGVAYFGAGVFPAEGLYLYAIDAAKGTLLWKNDSYGRGGSGTVSPQGYLVASADKLFVPSGRAMPAAFGRKDGEFLYHRSFNWRSIGLSGGTNNVLVGSLLLTASEQIVGVNETNGALALAEGLPTETPRDGGRQVVADSKTLYVLNGKDLVAIDRDAWFALKKRMADLKTRVAAALKARDDLRLRAKAEPETDLKNQLDEVQARLDKLLAEQKEFLTEQDRPTKWRTPCPCVSSMALARGMILAGGSDVVMGFDPITGKGVWSAPVKGEARGLAIAGGRLFVSTDSGTIQCFAPGGGGQGRKVAPGTVADPFPKDDRSAYYAKMAEALVKESGVTRGYALLFGGGDGRLALELARRTDLAIYLLYDNSDTVAAARKALSAAGVYGGKVTVMMKHGPDTLDFGDYFANLIVLEDRFAADPSVLAPKELLRMLKPCGGAAYVCTPPGAGSAAPPKMQKWLDDFRAAVAGRGEKETKVALDGARAHIIRGPLNGAGTWTHEYGEPGNTACGNDQLVRGPLGLLWFGDPGPEQMPSRHESNSSPLAADGRMFIEGDNLVMAYDAYNGLKLWGLEIPGARRVGLQKGCSNLALGAGSLFLTIGDRCLRLDVATGQTRATLKAPRADDGKNRNWAYIAYADGLLFGGTPDSCVFAIDPDSGNVKWLHQGKTILPTTICIGEGKVFLVDRGVTPDQQETVLKDIPPAMRVDDRGRAIPPDVRLVVALDARTGKIAWQRPEYISDCVKVGTSGGELTAMYSKGVLLLCGQPWNGHFWKEFLAGKFSRRSIIALASNDGRTMWSDRKGYRSRPLIVGDHVIAEPWSYDLSTGSDTLRNNPVTGAVARWQMSRPGHHCGNIAAAPNALFFRSGITGFYDLEADYGTAHFGGQRPGCWINCIPANGVVMMPEASAGCVCPFAVQCTVVFAPRPSSRMWGDFSAPGPMVPVKHLALAFGAPGDRKDAAGTLWLGYPRPYGVERLVMDIKLETKLLTGGGFFSGNADFLRVAATSDPWIYASGCRGLARCAVPVNVKDAAPSTYTVRMYFAAAENEQAGGRVFDIRLQGDTVAKDFRLATEAGGKLRAVVKEFKSVRAGETLTVELVPKSPAAKPAEMPLINGLEIIETKSE